MQDSAAALVVGGRVVAAVEEERLVRRRHTGEFPDHAIAEVLRLGGLRLSDLSRVGFGLRPAAIRDFLLVGEGVRGFPRHPATFRSLLHWYRTIRDGVHHGMQRHFSYRGPIFAVDHHAAHAASAFYCSPFERALVLTVDGAGDRFTAGVWRGEGTQLSLLHGTEYPHSVGLLWEMVTHHLGFGPSGAGKTMDLAAFGRDVHAALFDRLITATPDLDDGPLFRLNRELLRTPEGLLFPGRAFTREVLDALGPPRRPDEPIEQRHAEIAASLQARVERLMLGLVPRLVARWDLQDVCMAGGVASNAVLNAKLLAGGDVRDLFIQPAPGESGTAIGAALALAHQSGALPRAPALRSAALGPSYEEAEIGAALERAGLSYRRPGDLHDEVARLLAAGRILGWFQGRLEFGPRALGNRSILASPLRAELRDHLNGRVKLRESFRAFGAIVPLEDCAAHFHFDGRSPFMLLAGRVRDPHRLPGTTHADGSARLRTVDQADDPDLWRLLKAFAAVSGTPVLLSTSFNLQGGPIVCTPDDAIADFLASGIDGLAIGPFLVSRPSPAPPPAVPAPAAAPRTTRKASRLGWVWDAATYVRFYLRARLVRPDRDRRIDRIA